MFYNNRQEAAQKRISLLKIYQGEYCEVLVVQIGRVSIGFTIANFFSFLLDILLTKQKMHILPIHI